ncbi:hypothetical protein PHOSAC3_120625 [Mesotoga infera]|nr:hypothetical protein PHOSAC3_120625 [Mesotoga infera]
MSHEIPRLSKSFLRRSRVSSTGECLVWSSTINTILFADSARLVSGAVPIGTEIDSVKELPASAGSAEIAGSIT